LGELSREKQGFTAKNAKGAEEKKESRGVRA